MTEHPLTDEMCENISCFNLSLWGDTSDGIKQDMRAVADWQLQKVFEWIKSELGRNCYLNPSGYYDHEVNVEYVLEELEEAMRPQQQQQEDNS